MSLKDQVIVVTGASRGLGKALAVAFKSEGAQVIISGNNDKELQYTAAAIGATPIVADVRIFEEVENLARRVREQFGRIDMWVNNAGIQIAPSLTEDVKVEKLQDLFAVNFFGYFYGCIAALRIMKQQGGGVILNVNSTAGLNGKPRLSAYSASKFAVKGLSEAIREELSGTTVKLYEIFPGGIQTDIYHEMVPKDYDSYMSVDYAVEKVMTNLKSDYSDADLIIRRPSI